MKNTCIYIIATFILAVAFSCTDFLDIKPLDKMVLEDYWKTRNDVESTILSCYRAMETDEFMERIIVGGELRSDNVLVDEAKLKTPVDLVHINNMTIKSTNKYLKWQDFYRVINYCNAVLEFAPGIVELDPTYTSGFMRAHLAEAYALRALTYFYLVRLYRDVPYIDFTYKDDTQEFAMKQTPGDTILYRMAEQLETAEKYALKSWGLNNNSQQRGRVTKNMIRALLADIYLWLDEYDKCILACERIEPDILKEYNVIDPDSRTGAELDLIPNATFGINYSFLEIFYYHNSSESIFELQFNMQVPNNKIKSLYGESTSKRELAAGQFDKYTEGSTTGLFSDKDVRRKTFFTPVLKTGAQGFNLIFKYNGYRMNFDSEGNLVGEPDYRPFDILQPNWIFYRVADVYLMKAEALVERNGAGDLDKAIEMLNHTYVRAQSESPAPLVLSDYDTQDAMRKLVLDERQREFLFEGKRWFDLLRLARREDKKSAEGKNSHPQMLNYATRKHETYGEIIKSKLARTDALYLPIHRDELISNLLLVQNPYYDMEK